MEECNPTVHRPALCPLGIIGILLWVGCPVQAQDAQTLAQHEEACLAATSQLMQEESVRSMLSAMAQLRMCPEAGPRLLVSRWLRPVVDRDVLRSWINYTGIIWDERIFAVMLQIIGDGTQQRDVRLAALSTATYYANPFALILFEDQTIQTNGPIDFGAPVKYLNYSIGYSPLLRRPQTGARQISGDPKQRLVAVLQDVMWRAADDEVVAAAARTVVHQQLGVNVRSSDQPIDTAFVRSFRKNQTTMAEVRAGLGPPQLQQERADSVIWFYSYWELNRPVAAFGRESRTISQVLSVTFVDGKVVGYGNRMPGH